MSFISHGLRCVDSDCAHTEPHVFYRRSLGPPPCPECGSERKISWAHGQFPGTQGDGYGSFTPVHMGAFGQIETREEYNRVMGVIKERYPNAQIQVEHDSQLDKQNRADEARQRSHDRKKRHGLDKKIESEIKEMRKIKTAEVKQKATRHNKNPAKAKLDAKSSMPAAKLVGSAHTSS